MAVAGDVFDCVFLWCHFSLRDILDKIWDGIVSVFEGFLPILSYFTDKENVAAEDFDLSDSELPSREGINQKKGKKSNS